MNNLVEEWRPVVGYEKLYQVSNFGRVKSNERTIHLLNRGKYPSQKRIKESILKLAEKNKYLYATLSEHGVEKSLSVHRLVAKAFIPNPNNLPEVNHKDENTFNNCVDNLEWCDRSYNNKYGTRISRASETLSKKHLETNYLRNNEKLSKPVYQYTIDGKLVKIWDSAMECGRNGFNQSNISACCLGKRKTHKGHIWSYTPL